MTSQKTTDEVVQFIYFDFQATCTVYDIGGALYAINGAVTCKQTQQSLFYILHQQNP